MNRKKKVYLFQPQNEIIVGNTSNFWIPYSAGCLWSYVQQYDYINKHFSLEYIFFKRMSTLSVLSKIENPSIIGFSCYIWNQNYCLGIAKKIKEKFPSCVIVFGGPQVSGSFLKYDFIDSLVMAEGEESFLEILNSIIDSRPLQQIYSKKRLENLDIPSPYSSGVFNHLIKDNPDTLWATTIETNRGCPYACTFCDWGSVTYSKVKKFYIERIQEDLDWIKSHNVSYLFVADANFGIFKDRDVEIAKLIRGAADQGVVEAVNLQYAKNNTDHCFEIAKIIGPYNRGITVSVQSMNNDTLAAIKRSNLEINDIKHLMRKSVEQNIETYTEVILGLPLETEHTWKTGIAELLELGQHQSIDLSFTEILENSELNSFETRKKYNIKTIKAKQFYNVTLDEYPEYGEIVNSTSTMTTEQMAECYMYAWLIIHLHVTGYTQLLAKFIRNVHNVSYKEYYDAMFEIIKTNKGPMHDHFNKTHDVILNYLKTGDFDSINDINQRGDVIHFMSYEFFYYNQNLCFDLGASALSVFTDDIEDILKLQKAAIFNKCQKFPFFIKSEYDLDCWAIKKTVYKTDSKIEEVLKLRTDKLKILDISDKKVDFWVLRRKNLLKNTMEIVNQN